MTGTDLIAASLRRIGALGQGETPNGSETTDAQLVWNSMLDEWNTDRGNLYTLAEVNQNLAQGKQTYIIGQAGGADFNVARPVRIQAAAVTLGATRWPIDLIGGDEWSALVQRAAQNTLPYQLFEMYGMRGSKLDGARWAAMLSTSTLIGVPWQLYCDYGEPNANLNFWPVPGVGVALNMLVWQIIAAITDLAKDLTTDLFFPPGYVEAMRLNLALKLCEEWGMQIPPGLGPEAAQALAAMRALNARNQQLVEGEGMAGAAPPIAPGAVPPAQ